MGKVGKVIILSEGDAAYARGVCDGLPATMTTPVFDYGPCMRPRREAGATPRSVYRAISNGGRTN
jgi:hypothetical protein